MATNSEIATALRALAESANTDVAQHDLNSLADSLDTESDEPMDINAAQAYIKEHNTFEDGAVVQAYDDVGGDLFVHAPNDRVSEVDTPSGWYAFRDSSRSQGIGFLPER